ncbi:efflux transporter outer membrane subunit [Celerinatantimonas yamalensis]|uniref:Efflux transporter outer membrane subunit n=1 Tax=Celerinatantimonas yamalensis TaxID=559956 RepID=A0ABW9G8Z0_9GAMM
MKKQWKHGAITFLMVSSLAGCSMVGPDYKPPKVDLSLQYKAAKGWLVATPQAAQAKGPWWQVYHDPELSQLMSKVAVNNQNVAQYAAQYQQARSLAVEAGANLAPELSASASQSRARSSSNVSSSHSLNASLSWEVDLWGKLRRTRQERQASAQASAAELASATLSAQSELAQDYFQTRVLDAQIKLYRDNIEIYQRYLKIVNNQYKAGKGSQASVAQAKTQLYSARASMLALTWQRAQLEHAIAVLMGQPPATFSLAVKPLDYHLPSIPASIPASLLQRRPDIANAERNMASANAAIGVAIAGYYPELSLSASGGFSSGSWKDLLTWPARMWSIGPSVSETLFDFGRTKAQVNQAKANYQAKVANYRQTVLDALKEVEDYLSETHILSSEMQAQQQATAFAKESARVTFNQYRAGMIAYLDAATTQVTSLNQQQNLLTLQKTQLVTSVKLIAALGGGWSKAAIMRSGSTNSLDSAAASAVPNTAPTH